MSKSEISTGDGPGVGTVYKVKVGLIDLKYKTLEHDAPDRTVLEATSSTLRSYDVISFVDAPDGGTDVTYDATLELRGLFSPLGIGLGLVFDRIGDKAAAGLAKILDGDIITD